MRVRRCLRSVSSFARSLLGRYDDATAVAAQQVASPAEGAATTTCLARPASAGVLAYKKREEEGSLLVG